MSSDEYRRLYKIDKLHTVPQEQKDGLSKLWKDRFSDEQWKDKYAKNRKSHLTVQFWIEKGYSEDDAEKKISELQSKNSKRRDYKKSPTVLSKKFWMDKGYDEETAIKNISKIQSNLSAKSKKFSGKKHKTESKMKTSNTLKKYIDVIGKEKWTKHFGDFSSPQYRSNAEMELFSFVKNDLGYPAIANDFVLDKYNVDILVGNKIIEYFGDYWHASHLLFEDDEVHTNIGMTAKEIRKKDEEKIKEIESAGYKVLVIWEHDYISDENEVRNNIKNFLA
jgi:G:T-mismatch repair DNA endonuclease (very short patch repair protein)